MLLLPEPADLQFLFTHVEPVQFYLLGKFVSFIQAVACQSFMSQRFMSHTLFYEPTFIEPTFHALSMPFPCPFMSHRSMPFPSPFISQCFMSNALVF